MRSYALILFAALAIGVSSTLAAVVTYRTFCPVSCSCGCVEGGPCCCGE
jgi:hypothetical protein